MSKKKVYEPYICNSINLGINAILEGQEVVLVKYKNQLHLSNNIKNQNIASDLECELLMIPEIIKFAEICYGKNWKLRPCPIFTTKPYTIISKNIGMNLGLNKQQIFEFKLDSTSCFKTQELMFKLKPNHHLTDCNHIVYYNRYDGVICLEETTHIIHYNAQEYLLLYAPLLVFHKRRDMLIHTANICFETLSYIRLLNFILPNYDQTIRDYDLFAAHTGQLGIITHNGHPNPLFITDEKNINPGYMKPLNTLERYTNNVKEEEPDDTTILSGTFFKLFPSFLFRRNWFTSLGNQREHGVWKGALWIWIFNSRLNEQMRKFLFNSWVPKIYSDLECIQGPFGISQQALNRHQMKFILVNMKLLKQKLLEKTDTDCLIEDDFLPSDTWEKLLKRRVITKEEKKVSKKSDQLEVKKRNFHILPHDLEKDTIEEVTKSKEWMKRIEDNIQDFSHLSLQKNFTPSLSELKKELEKFHISLLPLDTFKQLLYSELYKLT